MRHALTLVLLLLVASSLPATAVTGGAVPVGADGHWTTDMIMRNVGSVAVTQPVGFKTTLNPDGSSSTTSTSITLQPGETRRLLRIDLNFDRGNWILTIDTHLEASVFLKYDGGSNTKFEVLAIDKAMTHAGEFFDFHRVVTDLATATGTWPLVMNSNPFSVAVEFMVFGAKTDDPVTLEHFTAPPGISQYPLQRSLPLGGTVRSCLTGCGVGSGSAVQPVRIFVTTGPWDGGTQATRYPEGP